MPKSFISFLIKAIAITAVLGVAGYFLQAKITPGHFPKDYYLLLGFYFLLTTITHYILIKASEKQGSRFIAYYMGITGLKLFSLIGFLGIYVYLNRDQAIPFTAAMAVLYFVYTFFDIITLVNEVKNKG